MSTARTFLLLILLANPALKADEPDERRLGVIEGRVTLEDREREDGPDARYPELSLPDVIIWLDDRRYVAPFDPDEVEGAAVPCISLDRGRLSRRSYFLRSEQTFAIANPGDASVMLAVEGYAAPVFLKQVEKDTALLVQLKSQGRPPWVLCESHNFENRCWLFVLQHSCITRISTDGTFRIEGVPEGSRKLRVWHPDMGYSVLKSHDRGTVEVEVAGDKANRLGGIVLSRYVTPKGE